VKPIRRSPYDADPSAERPPVADHPDRACNGVADPEIFFPGRIAGHVDYRPARAVCGRCPVREPCLQWAIETRQQHGFWGGATPDERRRLGRRGAA
jgi:WhiB family redox-sensing transcriptional regulator